MRTDIRYNEKNKVYVKVNYDFNRVDIIDAETNNILEWVAGWDERDNKRGRIYPAVLMPKTNRLMLVHRLVAYTFLHDEFEAELAKHKGEGYVRLVVDHIDNNPTNAMPSNLRWCTQSENVRNAKTQRRWSDGHYLD